MSSNFSNLQISWFDIGQTHVCDFKNFQRPESLPHISTNLLQRVTTKGQCLQMDKVVKNLSLNYYNFVVTEVEILTTWNFSKDSLGKTCDVVSTEVYSDCISEVFL